MRKIHLIMPMGGGGTRFGNKGFNVPKPLIMLQDKPFFYWAVRSIEKFVEVEDIIFVVLKEHVDRFEIDTRIKEYYPDAKIHVIPEILNGAVLTCREGTYEVNDDYPLLFNDCDHAFICEEFYDFAKKASFDEVDGALLTFTSDSPSYSYVKFDEAGNVCGTVEKVVVSSEAICGAYYFRNKDVFNNAVDTYLNECEYKEFFVSGVYNVMAREKANIVTFATDENISFGTPDEYDESVNDVRLNTLV